MEEGYRYAEGTAAGEPPGADRDLGAGRGQQRGGNDVGYDGRRRHAAQGAERAAEASRGWVWATPRWKELCASK